MNIYDISKKAGVSIATISRVINGSDKVSEKTRERVLQVIEESNYTPNAFARGLGLNTMKTVGILCADSSDAYLAQAVYYIEKNLRKNGYDTLLVCTGYNLKDKQDSINLLLSKRVDGIVLVGSNYIEALDEDNDYIRDAAKKIPLMILNGLLEASNIYSIVCDEYNAIYRITEAFINNGHTNLIYMYNSKTYSGMKKLSGFKDALIANSIPIRDERIICTHKNIQATYKSLTKLISKEVLIDGIITSEDILAIGALKACKKHNLSVPDKVFISGFNNSELTECCDPELTSIDNSLEAICNHCVTTLMGLFANEDMPKTTVFSAKIIERGTTVLMSIPHIS